MTAGGQQRVREREENIHMVDQERVREREREERGKQVFMRKHLKFTARVVLRLLLCLPAKSKSFAVFVRP
jgi:hypothetical protein